MLFRSKRIIPNGLKLKIYWDAWELPPIFRLIQTTGNINDDEMREVFNLGIGLILVAHPSDAEYLLDALNNHNPIILGKVE